MKNKMNKFRVFLGSTKGLFLVLIGVLFINIFFYNYADDYSSYLDSQQRKDASGFSFKLAKKFSYFHYYTGEFPLATLNEDLKYSTDDAYSEIKENGQDLIMEYNHWSRLGENARIWAFLPNSMIAMSPQEPSIKLFNAIVFISSLMIVFIGFWRIKKAFYGFILVLLINLTPFYLYEVYINQNIFALLGSVFFIVIGLNVSALFKQNNLYKALLIGLASGAIIGLFSEFRNEISIVLLTPILFAFFSKQPYFLTKVSVVLLCILSFYGSKQVIRAHFNAKFENSVALVEKAGGHVYTGDRISGHKFWHPVFCGLGDFDEDYGFKWSDKVAYQYATPILQEKYGMKINYSGKYHLDNYYDKDSLYYIKFDEISEYEEVVKEKVLSHIKADPLWYFSILAKRVMRTLSVTIPVPYVGWLVFYVLYFFVKNRQWFFFKLLIVSLPLSATSIIIYSGDGATYNSVFVYFVIISLIAILEQKLKLKDDNFS